MYRGAFNQETDLVRKWRNTGSRTRTHLIHCAADITGESDISRHHLTKAIAVLACAGIVETRRGANGGARLAHAADRPLLGDIVELLERDSALVERFLADGGSCALTPVCRLKGHLGSARARFLDELNRHALADCALPVETCHPVPRRASR